MRRFILACALAFLPGSAAFAQEAGAAQARIGALTLSYDAARWRVGEAGGALTIACVDQVCPGIVYEMTATPEPGRFCGKRESLNAARSLFAFERYATNIHVLGELAFVMTSAADDVFLDTPTAIFGCITRDDIVYRIVSLLGDRPAPSYSGGHALELLRGLSAPPARQKEIELGALTVAYPGDRWMGGAGVLECLPPTCWDTGAYIVLGAQEETADCVAETTPRDGWGDEPWQVIVAGTRATITFHATAFWTGCRNATPPIYLACAVHEGVTYRIGSAPGGGCRVPAGIPQAAFDDLLAGIRLRE